MKAWLLLALLLAGPAFAQSTAVPPIDPTKNVLDLVNAESKFQNSSREYEAKIREVEMRRIKELSEQKEKYDAELAKILRANQDDASKILSTQLKEIKTDLSDRMSKQERFQYETAGRSTGASDLWILLASIIGLLIGGAGVAVTMKRAA